MMQYDTTVTSWNDEWVKTLTLDAFISHGAATHSAAYLEEVYYSIVPKEEIPTGNGDSNGSKAEPASTPVESNDNSGGSDDGAQAGD